MKILNLLVSEVNQPYKKIDVSKYDLLYIDGYKFPCQISSMTCEHRPLKPPQEIAGMIECLKESVTFNDKEEKKQLKH